MDHAPEIDVKEASQSFNQITRVRRTPALVGYHAQFRLLAGQSHDGFDEIYAVLTVEPRGANDQSIRASGDGVPLPC